MTNYFNPAPAAQSEIFDRYKFLRLLDAAHEITLRFRFRRRFGAENHALDDRHPGARSRLSRLRGGKRGVRRHIDHRFAV
jgi:hypothetical protein